MKIIALVSFVIFAAECLPAEGPPQPIPFDRIQIQGELEARIDKNFDRLEAEKYQPDHLFLTVKQSGNWPGDTEGRTILGLIMDAQAAHRPPKYLDAIFQIWPAKVNAQGYFGEITLPRIVDEQQLAGHGWVLRGLCEYYLWKHDERCLVWINRIVDNLVLPTRDFQGEYPIDPKDRVPGGGESGTISRRIGDWLVSTDVGCDFIFLDGVIQAYEITHRAALRPLIETMIHRFLQIDLCGIKAQTHASLTGLRALLRYYEINRDPSLLAAVVSRFELYQHYGMTENYENYNWFERPLSTEPCAVVDSYMVATALWRWTGNPDYLALSEKIYYNALCYEQRANGGFGTQKCSGSGTTDVAVSTQEAYWCCTMRGGEGLSRVAQSLCFTSPASAWFVHFNDAQIALDFGAHGELRVAEQTQYPFSEHVRFQVLTNTLDFTPKLRWFAPSWFAQPQLRVNDQPVPTYLDQGFVVLDQPLRAGDVVEYRFKLRSGKMPTEGFLTDPGYEKIYYGPLLLGCSPAPRVALPDHCELLRLSGHEFRISGVPMKFTPVYHLMSPDITAAAHARTQILFPLATAADSKHIRTASAPEEH
jgi:hypothetical protein